LQALTEKEQLQEEKQQLQDEYLCMERSFEDAKGQLDRVMKCHTENMYYA